jgi:hypothetical protein
MQEMVRSAYSGQPVADPGFPVVGEVWIDRSGGGVRRIVAVDGDTVKYEHVLGGPRFTCGVDWLRRTAEPKGN